MRCYLLVKFLFCALFFLGLLSLEGVAFAQVYKSYDANGNVVYSDKPTRRSKEIEVGKPNLSDTFEAPPPPPVESTPETNPEPEPEPVAPPVATGDPADTNNDGRISRREKEEERKKRRKEKREKEKAAEGN